MRVDPTKYYAVISGDFIGFSHLPLKNRQAMYFILKSGSKELAGAFPGIMPWDVDMFRGDGWQMVLTDPVCSLRAALYFKAYIRSKTAQKKIDTRMAIAVGRIDYIPENKVSAGDGAAFRMSGRLLDRISRTKSAAMRFIMDNKKISSLLDRSVQQAGDLAANWTLKQANAIMPALKQRPNAQLISTRPELMSTRAMLHCLRLARWSQINGLVSVFEDTLAASGLRSAD
jgi:hypothetical protein